MEEHNHSEATLLQSCKLGEFQVDTTDSAPLLCHSLINLTETTGHQNPVALQWEVGRSGS